jgi:hypothetical protein
MTKSSCETLQERFAELEGRGLVDVKFYAKNVEEAATDQLCAEVESIFSAYDQKEFEVLEFNDSYRG